MHKNTTDDQITVSGTVTSFAVEGEGSGSAEIVIGFAIDGGETTSFAVYSDTLPQVFSAFATLLTTAYISNPRPEIGLTYVTGESITPKIIRLTIPPQI
jgi:hypothetical protein